MLKSSKGITLIDLACGLSLASVLFALVLYPLAKDAMVKDKANTVISLAVYETNQATVEFFQATGSWPASKEDVVTVVRLMRVEFINPYDEQPIEFGLGRPKHPSYVSPGSIRFIATDSTSFVICGYGSNGRVIKKLECL